MKRRMRRFTAIAAALAALLFMITPAAVATPEAWQAPGQPPDRRADELLARMTLDEKIQLLHGVTKKGYIGYVPPIPRLGVPALALTDGPAGVRQGKATALPAPIAAAASWNPATTQDYGSVLGAETAGAGQNVLLGPNVNIARVPQNGRTFEAFGEDPYLAGALVTPELRGIQRHGVIGTIKHFDANSQETDRDTVNEIIDQRALQEIYLPAFHAGARNGAGAVMCAYNKVNGPWSCENGPLLTDVLKNQWKYPGFVMSDWGATHSTAGSARAGMDLEMPDGRYFGDPLRRAVLSGQVSMATINDMSHRILRTMFAAGLFDHPAPRPAPPGADAAIAQRIAEDGSVLLKNAGGQLPLDPSSARSIAVIGADADTPAASGGGSPHVTPSTADTPLQAIRSRVPDARVGFAAGTDPVTPGSDLPGLQQVPSGALTASSAGMHGLTGTYYPNQNFSGSPNLVRTDPGVNADWSWYDQQQFSASSAPPTPPPASQSVRWTGTFTAPATGTYTFDLTSNNGSTLYWDGKPLIDNSGAHPLRTRTVTLNLLSGQSHDVGIDYASGYPAQIKFGWQPPASAVDPNIAQAEGLARNSDVAVVFARDYETEGLDRASLQLRNNQDQLISRVAAANPHTIVVLETGGPVLMPWLPQVPAVLEAWYPGERGGAAIASLLFGDANPAGKLPMTFPRDPTQLPANTPAQYPGINRTATYSEGLHVGYRHYDANRLDPLFPFGYGLSYTTFGHRLTGVHGNAGGTVTADVAVTNTGNRAGTDVVEGYVGDPVNTGEPPQQLKAFGKVALQPGQSTVVHLRLGPRAFAHWETALNRWVVSAGTYSVLVGSSDRDISARSNVSVGYRDLGP